MRILTKLTAIGVFVATAVLGSAMAAQASASSEAAPTQQVSPDSTGVAALSWPSGTFDAGSAVTVVYKGAQPAPTITTPSGSAASLKSAAAGLTIIDAGHAASDGSLSVRLQFTADASGRYTLTFSDEAGHAVVGRVQAARPAAGSGGAAPAPTAGGGSVDRGYLSLLVAWTAIGLAALAAGYVAVRITVRRQHALSASIPARPAPAATPLANQVL